MGHAGIDGRPPRVVFAWVLLVIALGAAARAQTVFPSDGEDPRQSGGAELLEAVCAGRVASSKEIRCRTACPTFTGFHGEPFDWYLARVTRGHFISPTSEDAALWMEGCEAHSENFGGTILLTRRSNRWAMLWYKAGVVTERCHKVPLKSGREVLVCMGTYGAQGDNTTELYVEDLLRPTCVMMAEGDNAPIFQVNDDTLTCGEGAGDAEPDQPYPITRAFIEKVEFNAIAMSVTARFGKRPMKPEDSSACTEEDLREHSVAKFFPLTKRYRIDFLFDGHDYKLAPASAAAARIFEVR
jgi:hypothetical protein